jgi:hypothetical protein
MLSSQTQYLAFDGDFAGVREVARNKRDYYTLRLKDIFVSSALRKI